MGQIVFGSGGSAAGGTTSITQAFPATVNAGDGLLLAVTGKYPANLPSVPTGFTLLGTYSGGAGSSGSQSGQTYAQWYWKIAAGTEGGTNLTITITGGNVAKSTMIRYLKDAGATWSTPLIAGGSKNTAGTAYSVTADVVMRMLPGDLLVAVTAINSSTPTWSAELAVASGATFGTMTERTESNSALGDQMSFFVSEHPVTGGPATGLITYTATGSSTLANEPAGASIFVVLRATVTKPTFGAKGTSANGSTSVTPAYPTNVAKGEILLLTVIGKYPSNHPTLPAGWTLLGVVDTTSGAGTGVADNGDVWAWAAWKTADGTETGGLAVTVTSGNSCVANIYRYLHNMSRSIQLSLASGVQNTETLSVSITLTSDPGIDAGDALFIVIGHNTDGAGTISSQQLTASGATISALTQIDSVGTTTGDDTGILTFTTGCTAGKATAAAVYSATHAITVTDALVLIRLRDVAIQSYTGRPAFNGLYAGVAGSVN